MSDPRRRGMGRRGAAAATAAGILAAACLWWLAPHRESRAEWIWAPPVTTTAEPTPAGDPFVRHPRNRIETPGPWVYGPPRDKVAAEPPPADYSAPRNGYLLARLERVLPGAPLSARIRITADSRYALYVNGRFVARGPALGWPESQPIDDLDLLPYLPRRGAMVLAVIVHHYGLDTFQYVWSRRAGLFLEGAILSEGGAVAVSTGRDWRVTRQTPWDEQAPRIDAQLGFQEYYDARREPAGWMLPGFDARGWVRARPLGPEGTAPWTGMTPRDIPLLVQEELRPVAAVQSGVVPPEKPETDNVAYLLSDEPRLFDPAQSIPGVDAFLLGAASDLEIKPSRFGYQPYILLDFGEVRPARLRIDIGGAAGGETIDIGLGERLVDGSFFPSWPPRRPRETHFGVDLADRYVCRRGDQTWQPFGLRGFRYALLVFRGVREPLRLRSVMAVIERYPVPQEGFFACNDPLLNEIWRTGARTLRACMLDAYVDTPWREQAQWLGDAFVAAGANYAIHGDTLLARRFLLQAPRGGQDGTLFPGVFPVRPPAEMVLVLPDYCLLWVLAQWDYYEYTADGDLLRALYPDTVRLLEALHARLGALGLLEHEPETEWLFIDSDGLPDTPWGQRYLSATFNLIYVQALRAGAQIAEAVGRGEDAGRFRDWSEAVRTAVRRTFVDAGSGAIFERATPAGRPDPRSASQHPAALALLAGLDPGRNEVWCDQLECTSASPYFHEFILEALCRAGRVGAALDKLRGCWGALLRDGHRTWPEFWDDRGTLCHSWSVAPTRILSRHVLGVQPLQAGGRRLAVAPPRCDLAWAEGAVPTEAGLVYIGWERQGDAFRLTLFAPQGATLELPDGRSLAGGVHHSVQLDATD